MLSTPYYSTKVDVSSVRCSNMSSSNYQPYNLFCIITQLEAFFAERGRWQNLSCVTVEENSRMQVKVKTTLTSPSDIDQAQEELNDIISNRPLFCVLFSSKLNDRYPQYWLREVLPYISVSEDFNPFIYRDSLYVDLALTDDFSLTYKVLLDEIYNKLNIWYSSGYITNAASISEDWDLTPIYKGELYAANWVDKRFAPSPVEFLYQRLSGCKKLVFEILPNLVVMHNISVEFNKYNLEFVFVFGEQTPYSPRLIISVDTLKEAFFVADLIDKASYAANGEAEILSYTTEEEAKENMTSDSTIYFVLGELEPYTLSTMKKFYD